MSDASTATISLTCHCGRTMRAEWEGGAIEPKRTSQGECARRADCPAEHMDNHVRGFSFHFKHLAGLQWRCEMARGAR